MNFINKKILIISLILLVNTTTKIVANTIIFKLNNSIYTSEDLEKRINYIKLKDRILEIDEDKIKNEYINALIFNEFGSNKIKVKKNLIEDYYSEFFSQYQNIKKNELLFDDYTSISYEEILDNLEIDIIRKIILEDLLNNVYKNKNKILDEVNIDDIYEKNFKYFSFNKENFDLVKKNNIKLDLNNIKKTIDTLNINNIRYIYENKIIIKMENAFDKIQESFTNGDEFVEFNIENNKIVGQIVKKIRFENEINYNLIKLELIDKDFDYNGLKCEDILNNANYNYSEINNLEFSTLNNSLKDNLKDINDMMLLNEPNKQFIIILCDINYNENFFKNYKINSQVNVIVNNMENEFIKKYSAIYNLEINN